MNYPGQILVSANDMDIAVLVDPAWIASDEEPVLAQFCDGLLRHLPVAYEDIRSAQFDLTDLTVWEDCSVVRICYPEFNPRKREAYRACPALSIKGFEVFMSVLVMP